ncbi:MAG: hypothetical protein GY756_12880 [bacterium]|nr:hypothetical protein [bacterium]
MSFNDKTGGFETGRIAKDLMVVQSASGIREFKREMGTDKTYKLGGKLFLQKIYRL